MSDPINPPGAPIPLTEEEIAQLATITPSVIADGRADAQRADPKLAALLKAQPIQTRRRKKHGIRKGR